MKSPIGQSIAGAGALALALLLAGCGNGGSDAANPGETAALEAIPAPGGGDWTATVAQTPEGGFVMGNPDAPVKVVEYASMTCPHCASFAATGTPQLIDEYVKTGQVSFELRNFVRDPVDLTASLLARCGGPTPFFKLTEQMFAAQEDWFGQLQQMTAEQQQQLQTMAPSQMTGAVAEQSGLLQFARVRGIPAERAQQCLANQSEIDRLVEMTQRVTTQYPEFPGTPSFTINGELAQNAGTWETLEPKIRAAL